MVAAAPGVAVEVVVVPVREPAEIEAAMTQWGRESDGLIVPPDPSTNSRRRLIVELAAHYWLPAISADRIHKGMKPIVRRTIGPSGHHPHHLISAARYSAAPIDLARLISGARQPKYRPD